MSTQSGRPNQKLLRELKRFVWRAGLACKTCDGCTGKYHECRDWTLHRFRATFITTMAQETDLDFRSIMKLSGHATWESFERYLGASTDKRIRSRIESVDWEANMVLHAERDEEGDVIPPPITEAQMAAYEAAIYRMRWPDHIMRWRNHSAVVLGSSRIDPPTLRHGSLLALICR